MEVGTSAVQVLERLREYRGLAMTSRHNEAMKRCHTHVMDPRKRGWDALEVTQRAWLLGLRLLWAGFSLHMEFQKRK